MLFSVLTAAVVCGQFQNHSLGIGANATTSIRESALYAVSLEGSWYIENGFDVFIHVPFSVTKTMVADAKGAAMRDVFATGGHLGVRYLFLEEQIRPYVGLQLSGQVELIEPYVPLIGPGAIAGLEFFVTDTICIGARGSYDFLINADLNKPFHHNFGVNLSVAVQF